MVVYFAIFTVLSIQVSVTSNRASLRAKIVSVVFCWSRSDEIGFAHDHGDANVLVLETKDYLWTRLLRPLSRETPSNKLCVILQRLPNY
jgi:hypothetical protein